MKESLKNSGFSTRAVHAGEVPDLRGGSAGDVVAPLHLSTTYVWQAPGTPHGPYEYIRTQNPTRNAYEEKLASLENARYAVAFASGMAAQTAILQAIAEEGDHIVAFDDLYGGTRRLFEKVYRGINVSYADLSDYEVFERTVKPETRIVWLETPTNPMIKVCDIEAICRFCGPRNITVVVDNTFMTPYFQNPLNLGADIVVHSSTKYIGGHSDALGGIVAVNDEHLQERIRSIQNDAGAVLSPFDSYLNLRGLKTLALRMERHQQNATRIAEFLESHPKITEVYFPGLGSHPGHELTKRQSSGFGGMISFKVDGDGETAKSLLGRLRMFITAESLGGVESLIEIPSFMTHVSLEREVRESVGITENLVRLSVGIEDVDDLISDLGQALDSL